MTTQALPGPQPPPRLTAIAVALTVDVAVACKGESQKRGFLPNAPATSPEEDAPSRDREDLGRGYGPVLPPTSTFKFASCSDDVLPSRRGVCCCCPCW